MITLSRLGFDVVHGCQLRCIGCPNSTLNPKISYISVENFNRCLGNIDVNFVRYFRFFNFGEAFLHPDLPEIINSVFKQSWKTGETEISTNAQVFNEKMIEEIFRSGKLNRLVVSCDGDGTTEDYERLRPPAKWDKLILFLKKTKEIKNKFCQNIELITRTICTTKDGQRRCNDILEPLGWIPQFREWIVLPGSVSKPWLRNPIVPFGMCNYFRNDKLYVDYDGTVVPCCVHPCAFKIGNLMNEKFSDIFNGDQTKNMLLKMQIDRKSIPVCNECEMRL